MTSGSGRSRLLLTLVRAVLIVAVSAHTPLSREPSFQPAGQDRRLRAATDRRNRQAARGQRDRPRTRGVVQAIRRRRSEISSPRSGPPTSLGVFETAYPLLPPSLSSPWPRSEEQIAAGSSAAFSPFFRHSDRSMASIGAWASGISESLIAIPHITRLRPLISGDSRDCRMTGNPRANCPERSSFRA